MDRLDVKLWALAEKGQIVPDRSLLKTPEQIAEIRKSADLNTAVLDLGSCGCTYQSWYEHSADR